MGEAGGVTFPSADELMAFDNVVGLNPPHIEKSESVDCPCYLKEKKLCGLDGERCKLLRGYESCSEFDAMKNGFPDLGDEESDVVLANGAVKGDKKYVWMFKLPYKTRDEKVMANYWIYVTKKLMNKQGYTMRLRGRHSDRKRLARETGKHYFRDGVPWRIADSIAVYISVKPAPPRMTDEEEEYFVRWGKKSYKAIENSKKGMHSICKVCGEVFGNHKNWKCKCDR